MNNKVEFPEKIFDILKDRISQETDQTNCDVIIPVYNAYSDLLKCLYSNLKYQDGYRIIFINDKSSDPKINELFLKIKSFDNKNIVILNNSENAGFVKTVNTGMKYSKNDVILLNSDTIVTKNWVKKLVKCAYSDEKIATVTPLSNNATICSVPDFCKDNNLPKGFTVDDFADFIEKISLKRYPEIPTAVGFCMYIKRSVINEIGYFDDETFGKGYGEENDFCMRVIKAKYKNVLCDDSFIYHRGSASFSGTQKELLDKNLKILSEKYPGYFPKVAEFCKSNPLKTIHDNIKFRMATWDNTGKKRILFILHNFGGGTESHVMDLIESMKSLYIFYILKVENNQMALTEFNNGRNLRYIFALSHSIGFSILYDQELNDIYRKIINMFQIDLIHIHHLIFHTLDIFDISKEQNIPLFFTLHDYYSICPSINLLDDRYEYCHGKNNLEKCEICLSKRFGFSKNLIKEWRDNFQKSLNKCDLIIAPHHSVLEILKEYYYFPADKSLVIEHGHRNEIFENAEILPGPDINDKNSKFHITYIGSLAKHKGSKIFYALAKSGKLKKKTRWSIFGESEIYNAPGYNSYYNIHNYGKYKNLKELKSLLKSEKVDLVFIPSIWPETFSYTLSEALASGIPVLVSDMGALGERVKKTGGGWTVDITDLSKVEDMILQIIGSPEDYIQKQEATKIIILKTIDEMHREYNTIYSKYILSSKPVYFKDHIFSNTEILDSFSKEPNKKPKENLTQHNLFVRFYKCIDDNGIKYTLKLGYTYLYNWLIKVR